MDLLYKVLLVIVVVIAISALVFVIFQSTVTPAKLTAAQAVKFVLRDLNQSNPNALYSVINVSNSTSRPGSSYYIVLSVVQNATKPCPSLSMESFDYPAFGLVPQQDNVFIANCNVTGLSAAPSNISSSPELAIVRSYSSNNTMIKNYVSTFGYGNTNVYAKFYPYLNENITHLGQSFYNVWLVHYIASNAKYSIYAVLDSSGSIAGNYSTSNSLG